MLDFDLVTRVHARLRLLLFFFRAETMADSEAAVGRGGGGGGGGGGGTPGSSGGGSSQKTRKEKRREKKMRNEPKNISGSQTPLAVNVLDFAEARAAELKALTETLSRKPGEGGKRVFQQLPRHMRRRAMSHNIRRLPRRLQDRAAKEMDRQSAETDAAKKKKKSRKQRRNVRNIRAERTMGRGQGKPSSTHLVNDKSAWLETHVWHAKRMRMGDHHGYRVAERANDKGVRQAYRSLKYGCLISDVSYECCVEIVGKRDDITSCLSPLFTSATGLTPAAKMYEDGSRAGHCVLYHFNSFPLGAIGPVEFLWQPINNDIIEKSEADEEEEEGGGAANTRLWLTVSPAIYDEVMHELSVAMEKCRSHGNSDGRDRTSARSKVTVKSLKNEFVRFRLIGPRSHAVVMETLKPVTDELLTSDGGSSHSNLSPLPDLSHIPIPIPWWNEDSHYSTHSELLGNNLEVLRSDESGVLRGTVVGMVVQDPRLFTPTKKTDMVSEYYPKRKRGVDLWRRLREGAEREVERRGGRGGGGDGGGGRGGEEGGGEEGGGGGGGGGGGEEAEVHGNLEEEEEEKEKEEENESVMNSSSCNLQGDEGLTGGVNFRIETEFETMTTDKQSQEDDPLIRIENETVSHDDSSTVVTSCNVLPTLPNLAHSPLWCASIRDTVGKSKFPDNFLNTLRSQLLVTSTKLSLGVRSPRIPIMLIRREYSSSLVDDVLQLGGEGCCHGYCKTNVRRVMTSSAVGWDLVLPRNWGMGFWIGLVYRGARACGREELAKVSMETGRHFFPIDYPDTAAGRRENEERAREAKKRYLRRPPDKKPNFGKLSIQNPFSCPWNRLVDQWKEEGERLLEDGDEEVKVMRMEEEENKKEEGEKEDEEEKKENNKRKVVQSDIEPPAKRPRVTINSNNAANNNDDIIHQSQSPIPLNQPLAQNDFYVLRSKDDLILLSTFLHDLTSPPAARSMSHSGTTRKPLNSTQSLFHSILLDFKIDSLIRKHRRALVGVVFEMLHRGNATNNDTISTPTISDLKNLTDDPKNFHGPEEVLCQRGVTVADGDEVCVGVSGLTRKQMADVKKKKRKRGEKELNYELSPCSPSRVAIGYTTSCGHRLTSSKDGGIGFVSLVGLLATARTFYQFCEGVGGEEGKGQRGRRKKSHDLLLLIRGQTIHYRFAKFNLLI